MTDPVDGEGPGEPTPKDPAAAAPPDAKAAETEAQAQPEPTPDEVDTRITDSDDDGPPTTLAAELVSMTAGASRLPADDPSLDDEEPDPALPDLPRGSLVGRYTILGRLSVSRTDVVFGAYDPDHERKVAIKLVAVTQTASDDDEEAARARTLAEAGELAKLSHPCIATVYEVGVLDAHVFVAMEFLDGVDLRSWLEARDEPFPWPEVLRVFREAGRGLAAAHRAGIVHRDFSPASVRLCKGGRICVLDFGLGRKATRPDDLDIDVAELEHSFPGEPSARGGSSASITRRGLTLGQPHYMAPEVHISHRSDARSDQFSFCVALYEALYGERPFAGNRPIAIAMEAVKHAVRPAPAGSDVPAWLREVVVRGLHPRPDDRWPSMESLLRELARDPGTRRRRWALGGVAVVALAVGAWGIARQVQAEHDECSPDEAALVGIWDADRKATLAATLLRSDRPWAQEVWGTASDAIDRYVTEWSDLSEAACVATHVRGEATRELYDLRVECLQRSLGQVDGFGRALDTGRPDVLDGAWGIATTLQSARVCTFSEDLEERPIVPASQRDAVLALRRDLDLVEALAATGDTDLGLRRAEAVVAAADGLEHAPLTVDARLALGRIQHARGQLDAAGQTLHAAATRATRARLDRPLAAAWLDLAAVAAATGDPSAASDWADYAAAIIERKQYVRLRPRLAEVRGDAAAADRRTGDAIAEYYRAVALEDQRVDTHPLRLAPLWRKLGAALVTRGDHVAAIGHYGDALDLLERSLGPLHPALADVLEELAEARLGAGDVDAALEDLARAHALVAGGTDPRRRAAILVRIGEVESIAGRATDAAEHFTRAEAELEGLGETAAALRARALVGHGIARLDSGAPRLAIEPLQRAVTLLGADVSRAGSARARFALARAMWFDPAERATAIALAERAQRELAAVEDLPATELAATQRWLDTHGPEGLVAIEPALAAIDDAAATAPSAAEPAPGASPPPEAER